MELRVGYGEMVRGRLDGGEGMTAKLTEDGVVTICSSSSPDKFTMHFQTTDAQKGDGINLSGNLGGMRIETCFDPETQILRFDSHDNNEFWLEVDIRRLQIKKQVIAHVLNALCACAVYNISSKPAQMIRLCVRSQKNAVPMASAIPVANDVRPTPRHFVV